MPTSLLDLPDELLRIICSSFGSDVDFEEYYIDLMWSDLYHEQLEDRSTLLSLCLASRRLYEIAHPVLTYMVQPGVYSDKAITNYRAQLVSANLRDCRYLVLPVDDGSEFTLLQNTPAVKHITIHFRKKKIDMQTARFVHEFSQLSKLTHLALEISQGAWPPFEYSNSLIRMVTHLQHLRDLFIHLFPRGFKRQPCDSEGSGILPSLDRLRITAFDDEIEEQVIMEFLPCVGGVEGMQYEQEDETMTWTRKAI